MVGTPAGQCSGPDGGGGGWTRSGRGAMVGARQRAALWLRVGRLKGRGRVEGGVRGGSLLAAGGGGGGVGGVRTRVSGGQGGAAGVWEVGARPAVWLLLARAVGGVATTG